MVEPQLPETSASSSSTTSPLKISSSLELVSVPTSPSSFLLFLKGVVDIDESFPLVTDSKIPCDLIHSESNNEVGSCD